MRRPDRPPGVHLPVGAGGIGLRLLQDMRSRGQVKDRVDAPHRLGPVGVAGGRSDHGALRLDHRHRAARYDHYYDFEKTVEVAEKHRRNPKTDGQDLW